MPMTDFPSKRTSPDVGSISFMIMRPVVVLPHPDSPTSPTVSPRRMAKPTPSTARTRAGGPLAQSPRRTGKCFTRSRISSSGVPSGAILVLREQAANRAAVAGLDQRDRAGLALHASLLAARGEGAPHRQMRRIGRAPLDRHQ